MHCFRGRVVLNPWMFLSYTYERVFPQAVGKAIYIQQYGT